MKVAFIGMMNLLDRFSGAALSARSFIETLAAAGHDCRSYTTSSFDTSAHVSLTVAIGPGAEDNKHQGKLITLTKSGVRHDLFVTSHTDRQKVTAKEWQKFAGIGISWIKENPADIYITYGNNSFTKILQSTARMSGAKIVFYLGNAAYQHRDNIEPCDVVVCPSLFLANYYEKKLGLSTQVLRTIIPESRFLSKEQNIYRQHPEHRKQGFVTFFNPQFSKGLGLVVQLVIQAQKFAPDMRFLIVSGRTDHRAVAINGMALSDYPNVWCIDSQEDVKSIYQRTSVLLLPSVVQEAASRSIVEAQLSGIPVIASSRGGNKERLNGGGSCLDLPPSYISNPQSVPELEEIKPWLEQLMCLWDNKDTYSNACQRAINASQAFRPEAVSKLSVDFFEQLIEDSKT
ncbi:glycosyltransferase family 4 protein [Motiliproteus sp. MSK22-1]|uniref:glycosyltransferase family 4 protein n=1 Tax=Motiliproteus sp. MSK22-1 TaxID=1897630 RepID=UPI00097638B1|nr:glycosyltransferase family 4 protein [Motiliproteus sp. MSK22-1]OMH30393.1 hypothetical protein BGP75_18625 [Motiliproteus sp. MSK22-1]